MRTEPHYKQLPKFTISGLTLKLSAWRFSCGAIDPADPAYAFRDLPPRDIAFTANPTWDKFATLYVVPTATDGDNYYLTKFGGDPALAEIANPPTERWPADISVVPCLNITIRAGATTLEVTANEFELPDPPDPRRNIVSGDWRVTAFVVGQETAGYELLDATAHASAFPISLGRLEPGESWYAKKETV